MAYVSKTWVDRDSQYPTRRVLVHSDLSEEQVTVRRDEGIITTQGDVFDANTMNNLEARIAAGIGEKQDTLTAGSGITIDANNVISATGGGGGSSTLAGLDDTNISSPQNGQALIYDATSSKWVNANGGSGSATLAGLTDVTLTTPTADQVLKYDGTKWVNGAGGGDVELSKTVSGSVCSFSDGAEGLPVKEIIAQVVAVQSGTGDPSPNNERPISGFTGLNLYNQIGNFWDEQWEVGTLNDTTGQPASSTTQIRAKNFSPCKGGASYYVKVGSGNAIRVFWYDASYNYLGQTQNIQNSTTTAPDNASYLKIRGTNAYGTTYGNDISINCPSTDTAYHAYVAPTVYPVTWQTEVGTVYGCLVNPITGVMTITHGMDTYTGSDVTSVSTASGNAYARVVMSGVSGRTYSTCKCNTYVPTSTSANGNITIPAAGQAVARIFNDSFTTLEAAQAALNAQPVQFVFDFVTPVTVQLTPTEVETLFRNNIWADTGDTTVTYYTSSAEDVIDLVQYDTTKQDKLTAGTGITIDSNNVISATGGGGGAVIDDTTTSTTSVWSSSKTNSEIATKQNALTAGFGINIDSNSGTISYDLIDDDVSDTLYAGVTSMTLSSQTILSDSLIDIYVEDGGAYPTDTVVNGTNVILIFEAQATDINVRMIVHHSHRP